MGKWSNWLRLHRQGDSQQAREQVLNVCGCAEEEAERDGLYQRQGCLPGRWGPSI